jgi:tetratricopeptide (TPR) repeat protein
MTLWAVPCLLFSLAASAEIPGPAVYSDPPRESKYITLEMDTWLMKGIDDIYRMRFDDAEAAALKANALNPEHPHPYLGLAGVTWTRYVYGADQDDPKLLAEFQRRTDVAVDKAAKWLKAHPDDAQAMMTQGAAWGIASRLCMIRHEWLRGYWLGRKAIGITKAAVKLDPQLWDGYLGIGMYDYYTDVYPRVVGVLAKIVLRGNRLRGIKTLELVAEKGHFSKSNAKILLVEIYVMDAWGARNPERAIAFLKDLRALYPDSAMMHSAQFVALYAGRRYTDVVAVAQDYIERSEKGLYTPFESAKGYVALGCALWQLGKTDDALSAFKKAQGVMDRGRMSRWAVWASIRAGQLEDALGRRQDALRDYKLAADQPDSWDFRQFAKAGLAKPFAEKLPGQIPPPD